MQLLWFLGSTDGRLRIWYLMIWEWRLINLGNRDLLDIEYLRKRFILLLITLFGKNRFLLLRMCRIVDIGSNTKSGKNKRVKSWFWSRKESVLSAVRKWKQKYINLNYKREGVDLEVEVIGIPANVCTKCFYRIIHGKVAKYINSLVGLLPLWIRNKLQRKALNVPPCRNSISVFR